MDRLTITTHNDKEIKNKPKFAYVCLVMKGPRYVPGAIVTAASILKARIMSSGEVQPDLVCMVTSDVPVTDVVRLNKVFTHVVTVEYLRFKTLPLRNKKIMEIYGGWRDIAYTKMQCLSLPYDKIVFLDADLIVVKNMDSLFDAPTPAATFSLPCSQEFKKHRGIKSPYKDLKHLARVPPSQIAKGYDKFLCISTSMVLSPSKADLKEYIEMMEKKQPFFVGRCINGSDETSMTWFYDRVKQVPMYHIHQAFNSIPWKAHEWLPKSGKFSKQYVQHYVSKDKPWEMDRDTWPDLADWWKYADDAEKEYGLPGFTNKSRDVVL
jgi:hypothetical protein